jgi:parallel beta-helix repeat protein
MNNAVADLTNPGALTDRPPIHIVGNAAFNASNGVTAGGAGTIGNPFVIENWRINTSTGRGILIENTNAYFMIKNCWVYNGTPSGNTAIYLDNVENGTVLHCRMENGYVGVFLYDSANCNISYNKMNALTTGISLGGTVAIGTRNVSCYYNEIFNCDGSGISNSNAKRNVLAHNTIYDCAQGIENTGDFSEFRYNQISNCTNRGMAVWGNNNIAHSNTIHHNGVWGIYIKGRDSTFTANKVYNNGDHGIWFSSSWDHVFRSNLVNDNADCGISISNSFRHVIEDNTIANNKNHSIRIDMGSNQMQIDHNHFTNNNQGNNQAKDDSSGNNDWDDGAEGNWWSDWTEPDDDSNGIVDDPYDIPGNANSQDNFPLTETGGSEVVNITTANVVNATEDRLYYVDYNATGSSTYVWDLESNATWLDIDISTGELSGTPLNQHVGTFWVDVSVQGGLGATDYNNFTLTVFNTNDPPEWLDVPVDGFVKLEDIYRFDVNATDVDPGAVLIYNISSNPSSTISIDDIGVIVWQTDKSGSYLMNLTASDGVVTIDHQFRIGVHSDNYKPFSTLVTPSDGSELYVLNPTFEWTTMDSDGEALECELFLSKDESDLQTLESSSMLIRLAGTTTYTIKDTEPLDADATYYWTVIPYDAEGNGTCTSGVWNFKTASNATMNHPPNIQSNPETDAFTGEEWTYSPSVDDEDGDDIIISLEEAPAGMTLEDGILKWTPSDQQGGNHTVRIVASDGKVGTSQEFTISVAPGTGDDDDSDDDNSNLIMYSMIPLGIIVLIIIIVIIVIISKKVTDLGEPPPESGEAIDAEVAEKDVFDEKKIEKATRPKRGKAKPMVIDQEEEEMLAEPELSAEPELVAPDVTAAIDAPLALPPAKIFEAEFEGRPTVDEVFLITRDGLLLHHFSYQDTSLVDKDILSAMLTVIQNFVTDSFGKEERSLKNLGFGDFHILIVPGKQLSAVVISPDKNVDTMENGVNRMLQEIEANNEGALKDWDGDRDRIVGVEPCVEKMVNDGY